MRKFREISRLAERFNMEKCNELTLLPAVHVTGDGVGRRSEPVSTESRYLKMFGCSETQST